MNPLPFQVLADLGIYVVVGAGLTIFLYTLWEDMDD